MLDEIIQETFDLDYQIYSWINHKSKKYLNQIQNPKFNSNDMISYVSVTKKFFEELNQLLVECNEQRQNLRTVIIKMSKDRMLIHKFFKEEDNSLILLKLNIHDELKSRINDKNLDTITHMQKTISNLQNQLAYYKVELKVNSCNTTFHSNLNNKSKDYVKSKSSVVNKKGTQNEKLINQNIKKIPGKNKTGLSKSMREDPELNTGGKNEAYDTICEYYTKNMPNLNLDFNTEKYNIISSSPIRTPTENRSKHKTVTNFKNKINKINNEQGSNTARDKSIQNAWVTGQGRHVRNTSFQIKNKYDSSNLLSFKKLKGEKEKSENSEKTECNKNHILNHNDSNVKSRKLIEMKNLETSSNYNYVNTNIDSNEKYSNRMDTSRKRILHSISKSIDFDMPFTNGNLLENKLLLNNEMLLEDPVPEDFISYQTSHNPNPQTNHHNENSVSPLNYRYMLKSFDENYKVETDHRENVNQKVKNPEYINNQRKKRNSMSEFLFTNFLNKFNLSARERKESSSNAKNMYEYNHGTNFCTSGKKVTKNESLNDLKSIFSSSNKKSSLNSLPLNHHRGTFCFHMKTIGLNSNPNKPNKQSTKSNNNNSTKDKWKV